MKYKLLALDLDDTLLNTKYDISPKNRAAIQEAVERGVLVTIATGRMFRSTLPYAQSLRIDLPLITYHGALIKKAASGEVLSHQSIPFKLAQDMLEFGEEKGLHFNLYLNDQLYVREENEHSAYYQTIASIPLQEVGRLPDFLNQQKIEPTKLTIINRDDDYLNAIQAELQQAFSPELSILQSRPYFLEVTHRKATKGQALKFLAEQEGIEREAIAAVGDSYNDVDMLQFAGLGAAVANAPEDVKKAADLVVRSNTEDGVAAFIGEYILNS